MIKIECEAHELGELLSRVDQQSAERGAAVEENRVLREKVYDLVNQVQTLKSDLRYAQENPKRPDYAPQLRTLITAVLSDQKITAIKEVRSMTGLGLKESKDLVEEAMNLRMTWEPGAGTVIKPKNC